MPSYQVDPQRAAPARLGRYELLGHLATGGMAEIHLARLAGEAGFEKIVVVKRLLPELVASPAYVAMFLDEGKLVARLDHPNICEVHELGRDGAEYYLAMPYLDGVSVHELISRPRDPDRLAELRVAAGVVAQACAGLHHAHELRDADGAPAGLVHRDVSPSNLFVTSSGLVKVLDFGVAKVRGAAATEAGTIKGKQQYMAPEQLLGEPLDRRCDVFALGIVLFELATHQRLFKRASDYLSARATLEEPIPRADAVDPAVPAALADVIERALARDRGARLPDAAELARALEAAMAPHGGLAGHAEIAATVTSTDELSAQRTRRVRVLGEAGASEMKTHEVLAPTRPLRRTAPEPATELVRPLPDPDETVVQRRPLGRGERAAMAAAIAGASVVAVLALGSRGGNGGSGGGGGPRTAAAAPDAAAAQGAPGAAAPDAAPAPVPDANAPAPETAPAATEPAPIEMPADLARAPRQTGLLSIDSTPYATIYIDGASLGVTPIVKRAVKAGRRKLRAVLSDGRTKELAVDIPAGKLAPPIQLTSW